MFHILLFISGLCYAWYLFGNRRFYEGSYHSPGTFWDGAVIEEKNLPLFFLVMLCFFLNGYFLWNFLTARTIAALPTVVIPLALAMFCMKFILADSAISRQLSGSINMTGFLHIAILAAYFALSFYITTVEAVCEPEESDYEEDDF